MASGLASFNARRNVVAPAITVSTIQGSSISTASITTTTLSLSTLTGSTITSNMLSLSTLTVSSINSGAPGVAAYSTLNVSSMNAMSSITTSSITTSSIITAPGYNSNISNVLYTSLADSGKTAADLITTGMPATAPSGSVISGSYRATAASGDARISMRLAYTFVVGTTYNFTFTGMQGSTDLGLRVYQYNTAGNLYTQIDQNVGPVSTTPTTITGSFTPSASGLYTGTIIFYIQALSLNPYVNFTSFRMTVGSMNVGIGMSNPIAKLQITQDGNSVLNEVGSHSMGILSSQGTSGTNLMYMMMDADYTNQCCSIQSIIYGLKVWNLNLNPRGGNVGIGTTNPGAVLHIIDTVSSAASYPLMLFSPNVTAGGAQYIYFGTANSTNDSAQIGWANVSAGSASNYAFLQIYGKANIMTWQASTGRVGIGLTNPSTSLHVLTSTTDITSGVLSTRYYLRGPGDNQDTSGTDYDGPWYGLGWSGIAGLSGDPYVCLAGFAGVAMRSSSGFIQLASNGNVGIGLTNPAHTLVPYSNITLPTVTTSAIWPAQLAVSGSPAAQLFLKMGAYYTGGTGEYCGIQSTETYSGVEHVQNLSLQPLGGNIGIGKTNPSYKLDVVGDARATGSLIIGTGGTYTPGCIFANGDWGMILRVYTASPAINKFLVSDNADTHLFGVDLNNYLYISQTLRGSTITRNSGIARLTINSDYNDSATGFAINASDNTTDDYTMKLYPYVVAGGIVGYAFGTLNVSTNYTPLSFNRSLVGINNTSPSYNLDVSGNARVRNGDDSMTYYGPNSTWSSYLVVGAGSTKVGTSTAQVISTNGNLHLDAGHNNVIYHGHYANLNGAPNTHQFYGNIYIVNYMSFGSTTYLFPIYIPYGRSYTWLLYYYYSVGSGQAYHGQTGTWPVSIWVDGAIVTSYWFGTSSDIRIKKNIQPVGNMLETINKIEIVSFDFIDSANNKRDECGVVAQQLETIFPNAVDTSTGIVPCYLKFATSQYAVNDDVYILFDYDHADVQQQFKVGDKIKIQTGQKTDTIDKDKGSHHVVIKSIIDGGFTTEKWKDYEADDGVFIYGKEVDDFRNVDKEQLGILALKGVQELSSMVSALQAANAATSSQMAALQSENAQLKSQVAALSASYASLLARLEALEVR